MDGLYKDYIGSIAKYSQLEVGLQLHEPFRPVPCLVGPGDLIAPAEHHYPTGNGTRKRRGWIAVLQDFEIGRLKSMLSKQVLGILDLILADHAERRLQVLPQQVDLGSCEHSRIFRGSEPPTG